MIYFTFDPRPDLKNDLLSSITEEKFEFTRQVDVELLKQAEILVTYGEDLTVEHLPFMNDLKWIFVASAGIEKMPLKELKEKGIAVSNVRGIHKTPMAESVLAHILTAYRSLKTIYKEEEQKNWNKKVPSKELFGSTAIILGPGAIGGEIGRLLQAFHVKTIGCNRSGKKADFMDDMISFDGLLNALPEADIVISVLPSTEETKNLITAEHFKAMKNDAMFMNFGRGSLVATDVLIEALENGEVGSIVCDVFEEEPLPVHSALWNFEQMTVSPHVSSHSSRYLERSFDIFKRNMKIYKNGDLANLENLVNLEAGY